jgi:MerR family transcriptional regulator, heat shock protein HspR
VTPRQDRPVYMIGVAAELAGMHPQTLRVYERRGLVAPRRSARNTRLYSQADVAVLRRIQSLSEEGCSLAGIERILELERRLAAAERRLARMEERLVAERRDAERRVSETGRAMRSELVLVSRETGLARRYQPIVPKRGRTT